MKLVVATATLLVVLSSFAQAPSDSTPVKAAFTYHLLLKTEALAAKYRTEIESTAPRQRLQKFKEVASKVSEDSSTRLVGGSLEWVSEGEMVKSFEDAVFSSKLDAVSDPVRTEFGWHLIYVTERRETTVGDLCDRSLNEAYSRADGQWKLGLGLALQALEPAKIADQVQRVIGIDWSEPMLGRDGSLIFFRVRDTYEEDRMLVSQHVELGHRQYESTARPKGCATSLRFDWEVLCSDKSVALMSSASFEGRGAVGRTLSLQNVGTRNPEYRPAAAGSFEGTLHQLACSAKQ